MQTLIKNKTSLIIRLILSLAFLGHGLVSFGYSPSYSLHYNLINAINITNISTTSIIYIQAWFDIIISILFILNYKMKIIINIVISYIGLICIAALMFYWNSTGSIFGIAECLRRLPWIFLSLYLYFEINGERKYHFIRIALSFAFIAHGFASLGFLGLNQGHIDLAIKIVSEDNARFFVSCSGVTDSIIGFMLLQGIYTRYVSILAILWITFVVYISFLNAIPDAIFRMGFLLTAIYVCIDMRTYSPKLFNYEKS